jgi:hypothetical protein
MGQGRHIVESQELVTDRLFMARLYIHDGKPCPYCRRAMNSKSFHLQPTRDHVIPRCRGGREIIICCLKCNGLKADMGEQEWFAYMRANPGWWLLTRAERKRRRRAAAPNGKGNMVRARQGSPPVPPVVVPPEYIWRA